MKRRVAEGEHTLPVPIPIRITPAARPDRRYSFEAWSAGQLSSKARPEPDLRKFLIPFM